MKIYKSLIRVYKSIALHTFNTIVLILLLNIILAGFFWLSDTLSKSKPKLDKRVLSHREKYSDLKAYTIMKPAEVDKFLNEQDAMGSIGFQYKPWLQFQNPTFQGTYLNTDEQGFRKTKEPQFTKKSPKKIHIFGGSTTFGYGVADNYTIPSFIQIILEQQFPNTPILVKNFGQGFYYSSQELLLLISLIKNKEVPDIVVFIDGANDTHQLHFKYDQPYFTDILKNLWNYRRGIPNIQQKKDYSWIPMLRLATGISKMLLISEPDKISINSDNKKQTNNLSPESNEDYVIERYKRNLRIIRSICREYNIKCYFIWQPIPFYKYNRALHKNFPYAGKIPKHWPDVYTRIKNYSSSDFLYLGEFLENISEKVFVDDVHYNEKYNEKIAAEICDMLKFELINFAQNKKAGITGELK